MRGIHQVVSTLLSTLFVFLGLAVVASAQTQSPSLFAANQVRAALKEQGAEPQMQTVPRTVSEMRRLVARNLDSRLLMHLQSISGRDFQYKWTGLDRTAQLGVVVLRYSTATSPKKMLALLGPRKNYFRNSKILTRFSAIPLGTSLVLVYSENSGDKRMVEAIEALPASFEKASSSEGMSWAESEQTSHLH